MVIRNHSVHFFPYRRSYGYLFVVLMLLVMSWEAQRSDAAIAAGPIPQESVRLRILANSDSPRDQAVKRVIRDAVVAEIRTFADEPQTLDEARAAIRSHIPAFERLVGRLLEERGYRYGYKVELGTVPFPAKMYGDRVYPAGDYEALRITLGEGRGQNWWCVLFPPLCFVDGVAGESAPDTGTAAAVAASSVSDQVSAGDQPKDDPEVKFFLWEILKRIGEWLAGLFG